MPRDARETIEKALKARCPGYDAAAIAGLILADLAAAGLMVVERGAKISDSTRLYFNSFGDAIVAAAGRKPPV